MTNTIETQLPGAKQQFRKSLKGVNKRTVQFNRREE